MLTPPTDGNDSAAVQRDVQAQPTARATDYIAERIGKANQ